MSRRPVPFAFVLDELEGLAVRLQPMFGVHAVYVGDKMTFCLRQHAKFPRDNGVWLSTTRQHHESLRREFPSMRSISFLGEDPTSMQLLPLDEPDFEASVLRACALVRAGDPRLGRAPAAKKKKRKPA